MSNPVKHKSKSRPNSLEPANQTRLTIPDLVILSLLAGALAASVRSISRAPNEINSTNLKPLSRDPIAPQQRQQPPAAAPETAGPIDRSVIAGGGGTSTSGNFRTDGTVGEVSASNAQSGGQFTMNGGYWNTLQTPSASPTATPTPTPTATPTPTPTPTPAECIDSCAGSRNK